MIDTNDLRKLQPREIDILQANGCRAEDWDNIWVVSSFRCEYVANVYFSGLIVLGLFQERVCFFGGSEKA